MNKTILKVNGFEIVATSPSFFPSSVTVYTPNGTVAMNKWDDDCEDLQKLIAIGQAKVTELCDFDRLPPHHKELVANQSAEYIAKSFNISPETAAEWKRLAG